MKRLKFFRQHFEMTQFELARLVKIRPTKISYFENGWAKPTREEAKRLADFFKIESGQLMEEINPRMICSESPVTSEGKV